MNTYGIMEDMACDYCMIVKTEVPDGAGSNTVTYTEGSSFKAVMVHNSSTDAPVAEKEGIDSSFKLYVDKNKEFDYHDIIKRIKDNQAFRITITDGKSTPYVSDMDMKTIMCEKWVIPT